MALPQSLPTWSVPFCHSNFLAEVDTEKEVEFVKLNIKIQQTKSPAYKSKQPFGKAPLLEDGDVTVFESRAIARYIAEKYQDKCGPLLGNSLKERAIINTWMESLDWRN